MRTPWVLGFLVAMLLCPAPPAGAQAAAPGRVHRADAASLEAEAQTLSKEGRHREALAKLDRAGTLRRGDADPAAMARLELLRVTAWRALGDTPHAVAHATRARAAAREAHDATLEARALLQLANIDSDRGDQARVAAFLAEARPLAEQSGDARVQAAVLEALGRSLRVRGQRRESLEVLQRAVDIATSAGDYDTVVQAYGVRSSTLLGLGDYDAALVEAQRAYDVAARAEQPFRRASAVFSLAQVQAHVWNLDRSAALWTEAIDLYQKAGVRLGVAVAYKQRMDVWNALDELDRAAADGEAVLRLVDEGVGVQGSEADVLARLALIEARRGKRTEARAYAERAVARLASTPPTRHIFVLNDLGLVALMLGQLDTAAAHFEAVAARSREIADPEYEWRADYGLGLTALAANRPADAQARFERAVALVDRGRRGLSEANLRASFMSERVKPAEALVEALAAQSRDPGDAFALRALEVAEQARGRALADLLAESRARLTDPRLQHVRDAERAFGDRFASIQKSLAAARDDAARQPLRASLDRAELEYEAFVVQARRENAAYASLAFPHALSAAEILALPSADEALIEYAFSERSGFGWVIRNGQVRSFRLPDRDAVAADVRLMHALASAGEEPALRDVGARLYRALVAPAGDLLAGATRLVIVPAGPLVRLPFAALRDDRGWLVERFALQLAPSASVLAQIRQQRRASPDGALYAFASGGSAAIARAAAVVSAAGTAEPAGRLEHAAEEARDVARALGWWHGAVRVDAEATEHAVKLAPLAGYRIVHVAAHAAIDDVSPRRSAIVLGPGDQDDGLLQLNEIGALDLSADLVVLATCRSAAGRLVRGEGLASLSRMFLYAGARGVVATLWSVDDAATHALMKRFYRHIGAGHAPDEALRRAQLDTIRASGASEARTWAAFTLLGDGSRPIFAPMAPRMALWMIAIVVGAGLTAVIVIRTRRRRLF